VTRGLRRVRLFDPATWARLQAVKAAYDPFNLFVGNHHIPPAQAPVM
jgi:FAD/FMN-containing dehydrogenase